MSHPLAQARMESRVSEDSADSDAAREAEKDLFEVPALQTVIITVHVTCPNDHDLMRMWPKALRARQNCPFPPYEDS